MAAGYEHFFKMDPQEFRVPNYLFLICFPSHSGGQQYSKSHQEDDAIYLNWHPSPAWYGENHIKIISLTT